MKEPHFLHLPDGPTFELIENGQILLLTQKGDVDFKKALAAVTGILYYLDQAKHVLHIISDMTHAKVLPEADQIRLAEPTKREITHPMLGIQTMIIRMKSKDYTLEKIMKRYNLDASRQSVKASLGKYKQHVIYFDTVEEAKTFLLYYNDMWEIHI